MISVSNIDQAEFWSSDPGRRWVEHETAIDLQMRPVTGRLLELAALQAGQSVLDIGAGTGISALTAAGAVGPQGRVLGIDISTLMIARAQERAAELANVQFLLADAEEHDFGGAAFDAMISRFGVMFFSHPATAFRNIGRALRPGARLSFAAWGRIPENPWFTLAAQAAKSVLGAPPKVDPDAPGPFAFRDPAHVLEILRDAGFERSEVSVERLMLTPPGSPTDVAELTTRIGPAAGTLTHFRGSEDDRLAVRTAIEAAFAPFATPDGTRIPAEINFFTARMPS